MPRIAAATAIAGALALFAGAAPAQQIVAKYSTPTINDVVHDGMKTLKERVEKKSNGRLRIDIYPSSQLGAIPRVTEGAQLGTIELFTVPPEFLIGLDSRFGVVSAPGVFESRMHGFLTLNDPAFKPYRELGQNKGIVMIGAQCNAEVIYVMRKPFQRLPDFHGLKIRAYPSALEREAFRRIGATVAPMPLDEVLPGLQQGVIDGTKGGASVFYNFKTYTIAKYMVRTKDSLVCPLHFASKVWWDKLPDDLRTMIMTESAENDLANQKHSIVGDDKAMQDWAKAGGEVFELSAADQAELKKLMATVGDTALENDPPAKEMYQLMVKTAQRMRSKL